DRAGRRLPGGADRAELGDEARDRPGEPPARLPPAVALRLGDRGARRGEGDPDDRPSPHLRPPSARRRDGPPERPLPAPGPALVRLLRPPPDRPADVARDGRPAGRALLPRLRPDLLLPEHPHRGVGDGRPLLLRVAARADR